MALSSPKTIFGIHSVAPYAINNSGSVQKGESFGIMKVLQSSSMAITGDLITLQGGSQPYPWQVENGFLTNEISLSFNQYPNFVYELFLGKKPTENAAEAAGNVSSLTDEVGTSLTNATTGIASISALSGSEADMKFAAYFVKSTSATEVDIYASTDVDFARGTDKVFENDALKITATPLTVPDSGGTVTVPGFGIEITGGSGTVALVTDDVASFEVRPVNSYSREVVVGGSNDIYNEFGLRLYGERQGSDRLIEVDIYKCRALGAPINFNAKEFSNAEVTLQSFYDQTRNGVFRMREIEG